MAINLDERYPGRAGPKTLDYPQGSFKNRTSPTSKDGTYLEQDWANDMLAFFQAMLKEAGITANGQVDTAQESQYFDALIKNIQNKGGVSLATEQITVTVGSGGQFSTINAALNHLSKLHPTHVEGGGITATIRLLAGFVMQEQVLVEGKDYGWITIVGVDAETVINEPSLTRILADGVRPAFGVTNGTLPTIGQLFRFSSRGSAANGRSGVMAHSAGRATILEGCGVKNAGSTGILASNASTIDAQGAIASGAGVIGIDAAYGSTINAQGADASGAGDSGIGASYASAVNAQGANASGAGTYGIQVENGSTINANGATGALSQTKNTVTSDGIIFRR